MKKLIALVVMEAMLLAGCGSVNGPATHSMAGHGSRIDPNVVASFKPGVTTLAQVEAVLGNPVKSQQISSGTNVILYTNVRIEDAGDHTPETGSALPKRHKFQCATLLTFDTQNRFQTSWTRVDDLGDASPSALGHLDVGDILTSAASGMP